MKLITRKEAKERGLTRYFTGKPCKHGHTVERSVASKTCLDCAAARRDRHWEWYRERAEQWRARNPGYNRRYGLPAPTRPEPKECENCNRPPSGRDKILCLDHCHKTGKFRGWLCRRCNLGIGKLGDDLKGLLSAVHYLKRSEGAND